MEVSVVALLEERGQPDGPSSPQTHACWYQHRGGYTTCDQSFRLVTSARPPPTQITPNNASVTPNFSSVKKRRRLRILVKAMHNRRSALFRLSRRSRSICRLLRESLLKVSSPCRSLHRSGYIPQTLVLAVSALCPGQHRKSGRRGSLYGQNPTVFDELCHALLLTARVCGVNLRSTQTAPRT